MKRQIPYLFRITFVCAFTFSVGTGVGGDVEMTNPSIVPSRILQGDAVAISYRVSGGGEKLSATAFVRKGSAEIAPEKWREGAVRCEPKYQIMREDMRGKSKNARCVLPSAATERLTPGPYSVFVAVSDPPAGPKVSKLGELMVSSADVVPMPERSGKPQAAIWKDKIVPAGPASDPDLLLHLVKEAGCQPSFLNSAELANAAIFNRDRFDLLILAYGGSFPKAAESAIASFLERAGSLLSIGGPALTNPIGPANKSAASHQPHKIADMESDALGYAAAEHGPKTLGKIRIDFPGARDTRRALRIEVPELNDWFYACFPLQDTGGAESPTIRFWAKGDANTDKLCLELNEGDGSRWKYFIRISSQWREYSVSMTDFASYATRWRGFAGDRFQPERAKLLKIGFYKALFERGRSHTFWIDEIERCAAVHGPPNSSILHWREWAKQYAFLKAPPPASGLGLFQAIRRLRGVTEIAAASGQRIVEPSARLSGSFGGWEVIPTTKPSEIGRWDMGVTNCARHIPLLEGRAAEKTIGTLASLLFSYRGTYRGSSCAFFCVDSDILANGNTAIRQAFVEVVQRLAAPIYLFDVDAAFSAEDNKLTQTWRVRVCNLARKPKDVSLHAKLWGGDAERRKRLRLRPGETRKLSFAFEGDALDLKHYGARFLLESDGVVIDELTSQADALDDLRAAADWLLSNQKPAGNFSNIYYGDVYGARALHALGRITGEKRYIEAAIRAADMMSREQRDDGGWWVGYGHPRECVFVADDGCIALGLVALAPHVDAARKQKYLNAAEKFVGFRESFRITDEVAQDLEAKFGKDHSGIMRGGLGIGYVRADYFAKKPYPSVTREMRQFPWTLHCSLAFLGGIWRATKDERFRQLAIQDGNWFLARVEDGSDSLTGGYANEAAVWILDTIDEPKLHAKLRRALEKRFLEYVTTAERSWWTVSGGRGALLLPGLVYCSRYVKPTATVKASLARAIWSLCGDASPLSISRIVQRHPTTASSEIVMYVCFSSVGLAELLQQRSTMVHQF